MTSPDEIAELVRAHLADEVVCELLDDGENRLACLTPLDYPSGDGVTVWVEDRYDGFIVTDYGDSLTDLLAHPAQDHKALLDQVRDICRQHDLAFRDGRIAATADRADLADVVWRAASAAAQIAQMSIVFRPHRRRREKGFANEVEATLRKRNVAVERDRKLAGGSGHEHKATLYLPDQETVFEPVGGAGYWNQVSTVYAKFGDLARSNGYRLFSLVDDREERLENDLANLLVQVSDVVQWSRRDEWLAHVG